MTHRPLAALALYIVAALHLTTVRAAAPTEQDLRDYERPAMIPFPPENPYTPEKAALGKMLYFDPRLSRDRNLSCASCHNPSFGWEVPFDKAIGAGGAPLGRHAPTVLNLAWSRALFWDGRSPSLEHQARGPIEADVEMGLPMAQVVARLQAVKGYRQAFATAFPREGLTEENALKAIATFERTIVTGISPFDRWLAGDEEAMSASAVNGFALFKGKARCAPCHSGWNFSDDEFHDIGMLTEDVGRSAVSGDVTQQHWFKTPGLRQIGERAPYMHNGLLPTLEAVVAHYVGGGIDRPTRSPKIRPLDLDANEQRDLVEFLRTLSSAQSRDAMPHLPAN